MSLFDMLRQRQMQQPGPMQAPGQMPMGMPQRPTQLLTPNLPQRDFGMNDPAQLKMAFDRARQINGGKVFSAAAAIKNGQLPSILQLQQANLGTPMVNRFNPVMPSYAPMGNPMGDYIMRMQGGGFAPPPLPPQQMQRIPFMPTPPKFK